MNADHRDPKIRGETRCSFLQRTAVAAASTAPGGVRKTSVQVNRGGCFAALFVAGWMFPFLLHAEPPKVASVQPPPGLVSNLTSIQVTFTEAVTGVEAPHFLVNGAAATNVSGSGSQYAFSFPPPPPGTVLVQFGELHQITDFEFPPNRFEANAPDAVWSYLQLDPDGPAVATIQPPPGIGLRQLAQVEVTFNRPVAGLDARDLQLNGRSATNVLGIGAGPYLFQFPPVAAGTALLSWTAGHGISSDEPVPHPFAGPGWSYTIDPAAPAPDLVINELLAENLTGQKDEDADPEDWIELFNRGTSTVNLAGWSLSTDRDGTSFWTLPATNLAPNRYLVIWASGKNRRKVGQPLHADFKLNPNGDTLRLLGPELPRLVVDEVTYPEQGPDYSYGRMGAGSNEVWRYFSPATFGLSNGFSTVTGKVAEVHFSVERGFFETPFALSLHCATPGAVIRYTTNGSPPVGTAGVLYAAPIPIASTRIIRAAAVLTNHLPSRTRTHTYFYGLGAGLRKLPALSLVTASNNLFGPTGIMEYNPRNTDKHGPAWERPVSAEFIRLEDNGGFQLDAGLRVQGGGYIRSLYNYTLGPPQGKYSFRLYFRGEYGEGRLDYPWFLNTTVDSFNTVVLRAGQNDHTNPYIRDELARQLAGDLGQPTSHGTFVNFFLNGVYKGYYNPVERITTDFLQAYHGGLNGWDVIGSVSELQDGDLTAWNQLMTEVQTKKATNDANYLAIAARLDLTNFVDYLLVPIYADTDDWPHNNWRAARERVPGGRFRFYQWDDEQSFGVAHDVSFNTINAQLSSTTPPWGAPEIATTFNALKIHREFQQLFADRIHKHFFNGGALTDEKIRARYNQLKAIVAPSVANFNDSIGASWIPNRRRYLMPHFEAAGFLGSSNAPVLNRFGGSVPPSFALVMTNQSGAIYYTLNGEDPRIAFTGGEAPAAVAYAGPIVLQGPVVLRARSRQGTNWSALTETVFSISSLSSPVRISELMYHPPGGQAFEYVELFNGGGTPVDLSGYSFAGVAFRFGSPFPLLAAGGRWVIASNAGTNAFQTRYPGLAVAGWFDGALNNGGERIALLDASGRVVDSVTYSDQDPWPAPADGAGASLERVGLDGDPDAPESWESSATTAGTPGAPNGPAPSSDLVINEIVAAEEGSADWVELHHRGSEPIDLAGWSLSDDSNARKFVFSAPTLVAPGGFLLLNCDTNLGAPGLHTGFALNRGGETLALFDASGRRRDVLTFGPQISGHSLGRMGGFDAWQLCQPTPQQPNQAAELGPVAVLVINEFLANGVNDGDWIELHNPTNAPVALRGSYLTTSNDLFRVTAPLYVAPGGFLILHADERTGPDHVNFKLPASGGMIALLDSAGTQLSRVTYAAQAEGVARARLPDGVGNFVAVPFTASPGASNYSAILGAGLRLNEVMARNEGGVTNPAGWTADWIELQNAGTNLVDLNGYSLSLGKSEAGEWPLPPGFSIAPGDHLVLWCSTNPFALGLFSIGRALPGEGTVLSLFDPASRLIDQVVYGEQLPNATIGRISSGSWRLLGSPTPGTANVPAATLGNPGNVRFNEWLGGGWDGADWLELFNPNSNAVNLAGLFLTDDPSITGVSNFMIGPLTFIPAAGFLRFHADGQVDRGQDHAPFSLDALGETIRLYSSSRALIDSVDLLAQTPGVSEGRYPDGSTNLARFPGSPTPAAPNRFVIDLDQDDLPDDWEIAHGLNPDDATDAAQDPDGDGLSNLDEFRTGTDPRNPASALRLAAILQADGGVALRFLAAPGRGYSVVYRDALESGGWQIFRNLPPSASGNEVNVVDDRSSSSRGARFYRVVLTEP